MIFMPPIICGENRFGHHHRTGVWLLRFSALGACHPNADPTRRSEEVMKTRRLVLLLLIPLASGGAAAQGAREKTWEEIVNAPVVYTLPRMADVKVLSDLRYAKADDPNLLMDVYLPPGLAAGERRPVVLFVHGGAGSESRPKDWGIYKSWGRIAAASGFIGVAFTHRLGYPKPFLEESAQDVRDALDFVRANAARFQADTDRACLAAYSAGGPLLAVGLEPERKNVRCLVAVYAFLDIQQSSLHREHEPAERVRAYSMIERLGDKRAQEMPMFVARAGRDEIPTMNDSIDRFITRAIKENANVIVMNHPVGVHGFDNQNDDARSREIIEGLLTFLKTHLRK
jgi:acetyl esterase/lipase